MIRNDTLPYLDIVENEFDMRHAWPSMCRTCVLDMWSWGVYQRERSCIGDRSGIDGEFSPTSSDVRGTRAEKREAAREHRHIRHTAAEGI